MSIEENKEGYKFIQDHWRKFLATVRYIITQLADELVEIVARGVMLMAPLPNAISMYNISLKQMGMGWLAGIAFAATIEFVIFFLIEVALLMLSRWLAGRGKAYQIAFGFMCAVVVLSTGIVITYVWTLETHKVMAWMPVLSLCSFIAIGLKRWDKNNMERSVKSVKASVKFTEGSVKSTVKSFTPRQQEILQWMEKLDGKPAETFVKADLMRDIKISRPTLLNDLEALQQSGMLSINGTIKIGAKE